jgi:hypothetical protein
LRRRFIGLGDEKMSLHEVMPNDDDDDLSSIFQQWLESF